jgi:hypothetical protein
VLTEAVAVPSLENVTTIISPGETADIGVPVGMIVNEVVFDAKLRPVTEVTTYGDASRVDPWTSGTYSDVASAKPATLYGISAIALVQREDASRVPNQLNRISCGD